MKEYILTFRRRKCFLAEEVKARLSNAIASGWEIKFHWIPNHCNISENVKADLLAENGCKLQQPSFVFSSLLTFVFSSV